MADVLPLPLTSALIDARDLIVAAIDAWGVNYWQTDVIGHAGEVTRKFLHEQSGCAPRAVVTAMKGRSSSLSGGKATNLDMIWQVFVVVDGVLEDRTTFGLGLTGELFRFIRSAPWSDDDVFARNPEGGSIVMVEMYDDADEDDALSIWGIQWVQSVCLGTAGRTPIPAPEPLTLITGVDTIAGDPNPDDIDMRVD